MASGFGLSAIEAGRLRRARSWQSALRYWDRRYFFLLEW